MADVERSDTSITGQAQAASYRRQIANLDNQIAYQRSVADINQQQAAAEAARAMTMSSYYDRNFELANFFDNALNRIVATPVSPDDIINVSMTRKDAVAKGLQ